MGGIGKNRNGEPAADPRPEAVGVLLSAQAEPELVKALRAPDPILIPPIWRRQVLNARQKYDHPPIRRSNCNFENDQLEILTACLRNENNLRALLKKNFFSRVKFIFENEYEFRSNISYMTNTTNRH